MPLCLYASRSGANKKSPASVDWTITHPSIFPSTAHPFPILPPGLLNGRTAAYLVGSLELSPARNKPLTNSRRNESAARAERPGAITAPRATASPLAFSSRTAARPPYNRSAEFCALEKWRTGLKSLERNLQTWCSTRIMTNV
ncbi:hypothetical protein EYF80_030859 [Liparis tanakae]|uniref:Uncharacterized protein n=1 Tax=Liparis tanakae TaxID=230148 RepID=A0A4Z2GZJ6_9TELE|nr:hypothetical protein EYF80_030859 [Liparis tanakae]